MSRILGLDHGTRRIGVAVADGETAMAFERPALLVRSGGAEAVGRVLDLARREGVELAILGLPRNMDGSEGAQARSVRAFGSALVDGGLRVEYHDERLSSWEAARRMADAGGAPSRRSGELDSAAARLILQEYLDARAPRRAAPERDPGPRNDQEIG